ncbi:hypothetical protein HUS70_17050 [Pandoraea nosoerga]|uniref:hypothetical protein n=1 Tax=Pandoraea nosoerga TaxID=2508296 RepID=UPI00197EEBC7|nr:hypothetical protein [Pandoraea nosoerga]MBN4667188.1 hypothetical protein [Pandoraea nosoerga]MBN4677175.1 hypothetical protein [Pandoraea nosoerga]MBN4682004.1 hypothetical protein [Pandoraea nosoerga]MBN4746322.1 hypothetical protein [Pandoraea nosoerga]
MDLNTVSPDDLRRAQREMNAADVPVDQLSELMRTTLAAVARRSLKRAALSLPTPRPLPNVDYKRRAAGDRD